MRLALGDEIISEALAYDADSGKLLWRERPLSHFKSPGAWRAWNTKYARRAAFTAVNSAGYPHGAISGKWLLAHRVAWFLHTGNWPECEIDHINGNPLDYRMSNIRQATSSENKFNRKPSGGKSRYIGVSQSKSGKWIAYLGGRKNAEYLGRFSCETAAAIARDLAVMRAGGGFARLNAGRT